MTLPALAGKIAAALSLIALIPYFISTVRGRTRPNRATWWIWTFVGVLIGSSYVCAGARNSAWICISYVVGPLAIALVSISYGEGGWSRFDRRCLAAAAASAVLWWLFGSPLVALLTNILIDLLGGLPTIRKSWLDPAGEDRAAWLLGFAGTAVNLLAVDRWTFAIAVYPVYTFLFCGLVAALVWRPRRRRGAVPAGG